VIHNSSFCKDAFLEFQKGLDMFNNPYNKPLYWMFNQDVYHKDLEQTHAKWTFISRMYSANLENYIGGAFKRGGQFRTIVDLHSAFEKETPNPFLTLVNKTPVGCLLSETTLQESISAVESMVELIQNYCPSKAGKGPVSYCSKYLHFHSRFIPIIDNDASTSLAWMFDDLKKRINKKQTSASLSYKEYATRFFYLLQQAYGGDTFTVSQIRNLDWYLVSLFRRYIDWPANR